MSDHSPHRLRLGVLLDANVLVSAAIQREPSHRIVAAKSGRRKFDLVRGETRLAVGDPAVDRYPVFVAGRSRTETLRTSPPAPPGTAPVEFSSGARLRIARLTVASNAPFQPQRDMGASDGPVVSFTLRTWEPSGGGV